MTVDPSSQGTEEAPPPDLVLPFSSSPRLAAPCISFASIRRAPDVAIAAHFRPQHLEAAAHVRSGGSELETVPSERSGSLAQSDRSRASAGAAWPNLIGRERAQRQLGPIRSRERTGGSSTSGPPRSRTPALPRRTSPIAGGSPPVSSPSFLPARRPRALGARARRGGLAAKLCGTSARHGVARSVALPPRSGWIRRRRPSAAPATRRRLQSHVRPAQIAPSSSARPGRAARLAGRPLHLRVPGSRSAARWRHYRSHLRSRILPLSRAELRNSQSARATPTSAPEGALRAWGRRRGTGGDGRQAPGWPR